jgi:transposase
VPNQYSDPQPYQDKETLERLYHDEGMTAKEIGEHFDVSQATISRWLDRRDVETKTSAEKREERGTHHRPVKEGPHTDEEWLRECYFGRKMSITEMADEAGLKSEVSIMRQMDRYGIDRRPNYVTRVLRDPGAGFVHADAYGYEIIRHSVDDQIQYYKHHRLIAMAEHGIEEVKQKHIHHKNNIPWDNRPENLQLVDGNKEHAQYHKDEWGGQGRPNAPRDEDTGRFTG